LNCSTPFHLISKKFKMEINKLYLLIGVVFILFPINKFFAQNITLINAGISGNTSLDVLNRLSSDVIPFEPDLVILMIGTNDLLNTNNLLGYKEYESNLVEIVNALRERCIKILLLSPPPVDEVYLYQRHDKRKYKNRPNKMLNKISESMKRLVDREYVKFFDLNNELLVKGIPYHNKDKVIMNMKNSGREDGVHLTPFGYRLIANMIAKYLKSYNWVLPQMKILCLGDSITYGKYVLGEGTSTGHTYPFFLKRKLNQS